MQKNAKFIAFEGTDGSGVTTQAELARNWLLKHGYEVFFTKEPTDGPAGAMIRLYLAKRLSAKKESAADGQLDDHTLALLFAADRMDHLYNDILPKLDSGVTVITDRYYLSSFAYQSLSIDLDWIRQINSKCIEPDITFFIDVPATICKKRIERQRWHIEIYEEVERLERVRQNYLNIIRKLLQEGKPMLVIDGNQPIQKAHAQILPTVRKVLSKGPVKTLEQLPLLSKSESRG